MAIYIDNQHRIKDIFINVNGQKKRIKSMWGDKNGVPTKVYQKKTSSDIEVDPETIAPINEIDNWDYTLNENNKVITLNYYKNTYSEQDVIVYANYNLDGQIYKTKLSNYNNTNKYMFRNAKLYCNISFQHNIDTSDVIDMSYMFANAFSADTEKIGYGINLENLDTSNVRNMSYMFEEYNCYYKPINISMLNTSNVTNMYGMFSGYLPETIIGLDQIETSKVTDVSYMFSFCRNLKTLNFIKYGGCLQTMEYTFCNCEKLTSLTFHNLFTTRQVTSYNHLFDHCIALTTLDLSSFSTPLYQNENDDWQMMYYMFYDMPKLTTIYVNKNSWTVPANSYGMIVDCGTSTLKYK